MTRCACKRSNKLRARRLLTAPFLAQVADFGRAQMPAVFALAFLCGICASAQTEALVKSSNPCTIDSSTVGAEPSGAKSSLPAPAPAKPAEAQGQTWNWHMQSTVTGQGYPSLTAKYAGVNSLPTAGQARETVSLDFFGGYRLWRGAEFHVDLLTWQGFGLDGTLGIDDFTNGEAYKIGVRYPHTDIARFFIRQTFELGGEKEAVPSDQLTLAGDQQATRLAFTARPIQFEGHF